MQSIAYCLLTIDYMIYIGADHGGYLMKGEVKKWFLKEGVEFVDVGASEFMDGDDYPVYAKKVANFVAKDLKKNFGVLICRSGIGMAVAANKVKGVRAGVVWDEKLAVMSKNDDFCNVLCLPSDYVKLKKALLIVSNWLKSSYSTEERHKRRVKQIANMEKK